MTRPANVVFNPKHRVGLAGFHYNHQAFVFRRGHSLFRRAYYLGPGGDVFFYDEPEPVTDPAYVAYANDGTLPACPEDSDDCQGLAQSYATADQANPAPEALQFIMSLNGSCQWQENGWLVTYDDEGDQQLYPFNQLSVTLTQTLLGFEILRAETASGFVCNLMRGNYEQNKPSFDQGDKST